MLLFLKRQICLVIISGIPIRVDYRWVLVLILMTALTAVSLQPLTNNVAGSIMLGAVATMLFFLSIFIHEYSHAVLARVEGLNVVEIVLHPFGGLTRFEHPPETARSEFRIAIAGPAASFALTILFVGAIGISSYLGTDILTLILFLLALTNFLIAVFNLFPGYPLDGGRVLRAYLWKQGKDLNEATVLTGRCGQIISVGLIVLGLVVVVVRAEFFTGFWAVVVGFFLLDSASSIIKEVNSEENVPVETLMLLPSAVPLQMTIQAFIDEVLPMHRKIVFPVSEGGYFRGMLLLEDVKAHPAENWRSATVRSIMRPAAGDQFLHSANSIADARTLIESNGIGAAAVVSDDGRLVGFVDAGALRKRP